MKQTLKRIIRNVKSINGNSLAEFATTTALMATLAATAAPKLSEMSEGTKAEKSMNEIDKILTQARNHYQTTADTEGRGRFPGQEKYNVHVGGYTDESVLVADMPWQADHGIKKTFREPASVEVPGTWEEHCVYASFGLSLIIHIWCRSGWCLRAISL